MNEIITGDALESLKTLESESVDCVITSPPYYGLRDYGISGQIGHEDTPEEFIKTMVNVFQEVRRVLKKDGTLWLNIGDSYCGSWGNYSGKNRGAGRQRTIRTGSKVENPAYEGSENWRPPTSRKSGTGIKSKDLFGIPWMLAFAMRTDGWYLRQDIIWSKPNPMPESVQDRCTKSHEYVFLMSKSQKYYYDYKAICIRTGDEMNEEEYEELLGEGYHNHESDLTLGQRIEKGKNAIPPWGVNRRSVWNFSTMPFKEAHFATFPEKLIEPMVLAGCPRGGGGVGPLFRRGDHRSRCKKVRAQLHRHRDQSGVRKDGAETPRQYTK